MQVARVKIKVKKRVKIARFQLYHILECNAQRDCIPKNVPNKHMFFGTVVARGKSKNTWNVKWDILSQNNNFSDIKQEPNSPLLKMVRRRRLLKMACFLTLWNMTVTMMKMEILQKSLPRRRAVTLSATWMQPV
jgi:hypothetical protein